MGVLDSSELSECRDVSKLREVLECCEVSESHEVSVCHKVFRRLKFYFVSSQMLWSFRVP